MRKARAATWSRLGGAAVWVAASCSARRENEWIGPQKFPRRWAQIQECMKSHACGLDCA